MEITFAVASDIAGIILFCFVAAYIALTKAQQPVERALSAAAMFSAIWLATSLYEQATQSIHPATVANLDLVRIASWLGALYTLLGLNFLPGRRLGPMAFGVTILILAILALLLWLNFWEIFVGTALFSKTDIQIAHVSLSIIALLIIEQVWRNSSNQGKANVKYILISTGIVFGYDFVMYSDALLFGEISPTLENARTGVNLLAIPTLMLSLVNRKDTPIAMQVSRHVVFHTTTFVLGGIYLLCVAAGGYYINSFGGTWAEALRVLFLSAGTLVLILILSSASIRAKIMVFISKNFFDYKYDYREEWIHSTNTLKAFEDSSIAMRTVEAMGRLIGSTDGCIWCRNSDGNYAPKGTMGNFDSRMDIIDEHSDIVCFFKEYQWIIDIHEFMEDPAKYNLIEIPECILDANNGWLVVPLKLNEQVSGFVLLCEPLTPLELNWENYDILKIVAQQASSYLEQSYAQDKLAEARQFEAVNKTSAFLIHDIKTVIAQLSLLNKNAEKHKHNPAFIEEMIKTTRHSVEKMDHLVLQIRNPASTDKVERLNFNEIINEISESFHSANPVPKFSLVHEELWLNADKEQLSSAVGHIIQNAIDATPKDGEVSVSIKPSHDSLFIFVQDSGSGMSADFIKDHLFKPFDSTKGLTGMGIGVYQSREYLRKLGGNISVSSELGLGTCFTLKIPVLKNDRSLSESTN